MIKLNLNKLNIDAYMFEYPLITINHKIFFLYVMFLDII